MGLDMYVYKTKLAPKSETNGRLMVRPDLPDYIRYGIGNWGLQCAFPKSENPKYTYMTAHDGIKFFYWRKHPNLHGWMQKLWEVKGGKPWDEGWYFNGDIVELSKDDILNLKECVERDMLPHTTGFFFGESSPEYKERDRVFIQKALRAIEEGYYLYYESSW